MKRFLLSLAALLSVFSLCANDSMYFTVGNQLVPIHANDIRLRSEVLTITLLNDGFAQVDVLYKLDNLGEERTVTMGFEANAPYMGEDFNPAGVHPHINDFKVEMNGTSLSYKNALVLLDAIDKDQNLTVLDPSVWTQPRADMDYFDPSVYNAALDSVAIYSYAYYFDAHFKKGINTVHHTYRYRVGIRVGESFFLDYKLTPALRWQGGQIDDFTLIIRADQTFKHFVVLDQPFGNNPAWAINGTGKQRAREYVMDFGFDDNGNSIDAKGHATEFALRNAEVRFHATNFKPAAELSICSGDSYSFFSGRNDMYEFARSYDPGHPSLVNFVSMEITPKVNGKPLPVSRIRRNLPFAARGYVFKDKQLKNYFRKIWWYMPDPNYKADLSGLLPIEREFINSIDHPTDD